MGSLFSRARSELLEPQVVAKRVRALLPSLPVRPLRNIVYSHGGYMAAATEMLGNVGWCQQLQQHTPHAYAQLCRTLGVRGSGLSSSRVMSALENNPVVAAFGSLRARSHTSAPPAIELDVYLHPSVCASVERRFLTQDADLSDDALGALADELIETTLVAHGSMLHTICERILGLSMYAYIFRRNGGVSVSTWLSIFDASGAVDGRRMQENPPLSVFLDVKSAAATPRALLLLVRAINGRGVHVWGVGSFVHRQITLSEWSHVEQRVTRLRPPLPAPLPLHIFTYAAQIQAACAAGRLPLGAHVLFNGGSLLPETSSEPGPCFVPAQLLQELSSLASKHRLHLGFYAAEQRLCAAAVNALTDCANEHPDLFVHGFAYSGLPGLAAADLIPTDVSPLHGVSWPPQWLSVPLGWATRWTYNPTV
jgi:hypothetical protein